MKYANSLVAFALAAATLTVHASPVAKRESAIVCEPLEGKPVVRLVDTQFQNHPQAKAAAAAAQKNGVHTNTIATEGLIGVDSNKVFYELYQDNTDLAAHFILQNCNTTALNLNKDTMLGDTPVKMVYADDHSLCASAIDVVQAESTSTPLQLLPCQGEDNSGLKAQMWALKPDGKTLAFVGQRQDNSQNYWSSETGGGDTYRTPNVMQHACASDDTNCQAGAIQWEALY